MARILYLGTAGSDDLKGKNARSTNPKVIAEKVAAIDKVVSLYGRNLMTPGLTLKSLLVGTLVVVGSATAADAPKITVTNVDKIVGPDFLGDKPVKFSPAAQISNVGILAGQVKKIRLHTHELEDHVVYVVRGQATARLGDERREVGPGDLISIPKRVPHSFEQKGAEPFVILVNATPGWEPLNDTKFLE